MLFFCVVYCVCSFPFKRKFFDRIDGIIPVRLGRMRLYDRRLYVRRRGFAICTGPTKDSSNVKRAESASIMQWTLSATRGHAQHHGGRAQFTAAAPKRDALERARDALKRYQAGRPWLQDKKPRRCARTRSQRPASRLTQTTALPKQQELGTPQEKWEWFVSTTSLRTQAYNTSCQMERGRRKKFVTPVKAATKRGMISSKARRVCATYVKQIAGRICD